MALTLSAWLVPKIFNGDIKTHRLLSKVEEDKRDSEKSQTVGESAQRSLELIGNTTES